MQKIQFEQHPFLWNVNRLAGKFVTALIVADQDRKTDNIYAEIKQNGTWGNLELSATYKSRAEAEKVALQHFVYYEKIYEICDAFKKYTATFLEYGYGAIASMGDWEKKEVLKTLVMSSEFIKESDIPLIMKFKDMMSGIERIECKGEDVIFYLEV